MSKKTDELLAKARELDNITLQDAIEALEFLGDEATANHQEYKDLAGLVKQVKKEDKDQDAKDDQDDQDAKDDQDDQDAKDAKDAKPLRYKGIKMIGSLWYSTDDNYQTGFSTADECAMHFNEQ